MAFSKSNILIVSWLEKQVAGSLTYWIISNESLCRYWTVKMSYIYVDPVKYFEVPCEAFLLNLILCLDFIFDLVFGFHRCSIKHLGVWMVSGDGCLKVAGSHKHSTAIVLESKTKVYNLGHTLYTL